jgi:hypothetical protein
MKIYKYLKEESHYKTWQRNNFVFTGLTNFLGKENNHKFDNHEGSYPAEFPESCEIKINGYEIPLTDYIPKDKPVYMKIPKKAADQIFISSFSKKRDCEILKKEFGEFVVEIDFNQDLQNQFKNYGIGFGDVNYSNKEFISLWNPQKDWYQLATELGKDNLRKCLLLKTEEYTYQEEFRFFFTSSEANQLEDYTGINISNPLAWEKINL